MKIGSIVKLNNKALKEFYSTNKNVDMYSITGKDLEGEYFIRYVDDIISFEDGNFGGIVTNIIQNTVWVKIKSRLTGEWKTGYYEKENLDLVME